jgi:hypothetical protein
MDGDQLEDVGVDIVAIVSVGMPRDRCGAITYQQPLFVEPLLSNGCI